MMNKPNVIAETGSHAFVMIREFNAPRELVFRAFTEPSLIAKWWGSRNSTTTVDKLEAKHGGLWRFVSRDAEGNEYAFRGVYHEVNKPERIVYTFEFEGMPGHIILETISLEEKDGKTIVTDSSVFQSVEARDGMIEAGMESGANESWQMLEELLASMES
jgi:uncharacterized protein YndB with AHSA1/START domain